MARLATIFFSWLLVSVIFFTGFCFDGMPLSFATLGDAFVLFLLIAFFVGIYFIAIGLPVLYVLFKLQLVKKAHFIFAGLLASLPMLLISIISQEIEWVLASLVAGFVAGWVFAVKPFT